MYQHQIRVTKKRGFHISKPGTVYIVHVGICIVRQCAHTRVPYTNVLLSRVTIARDKMIIVAYIIVCELGRI